MRIASRKEGMEGNGSSGTLLGLDWVLALPLFTLVHEFDYVKNAN